MNPLPVIHLVPAGKPIGTTVCGLLTETPDRPWQPGLVPDAQWMGPLGDITCPDCLAAKMTQPDLNILMLLVHTMTVAAQERERAVAGGYHSSPDRLTGAGLRVSGGRATT